MKTVFFGIYLNPYNWFSKQSKVPVVDLDKYLMAKESDLMEHVKIVVDDNGTYKIKRRFVDEPESTWRTKYTSNHLEEMQDKFIRMYKSRCQMIRAKNERDVD